MLTPKSIKATSIKENSLLITKVISVYHFSIKATSIKENSLLITKVIYVYHF